MRTVDSCVIHANGGDAPCVGVYGQNVKPGLVLEPFLSRLWFS